LISASAVLGTLLLAAPAYLWAAHAAREALGARAHTLHKLEEFDVGVVGYVLGFTLAVVLSLSFGAIGLNSAVRIGGFATLS